MAHYEPTVAQFKSLLARKQASIAFSRFSSPKCLLYRRKKGEDVGSEEERSAALCPPHDSLSGGAGSCEFCLEEFQSQNI